MLNVWIYQFVGYILQTIWSIILFYQAMLNLGGMKWDKKCRVCMIATIEVLSGIIFTCLCVQLHNANGSNSGCDLYMCIMILFWMMFFYVISNRRSFIIFFTVVIISIHYSAIVYTFNSIIMTVGHFRTAIEPFPYYIENIIGLLCINGIMFPVFDYLLQRFVFRYFLEAGVKLQKHGVWLMIVAFVSFCITATCTPLDQYRLSAIISLLCITVTDIALYYYFFYTNLLTREQSRLDEKIRMVEAEYLQNQNIMSTVRRMRHDVRHHVRYILALLDNQKLSEMREYLQNYETSIKIAEQQKFCSYVVVDQILKYYESKLEQVQAKFTADIDIADDYTFNPVDITGILGNCLENALNECKCLPSDQRYVTIWMRQKKMRLLIQIENVCSQEKEIQKGEFKLLEKEKIRHDQIHGFGLQSILYLSEKYHGTVEIARPAHCFITRIMLQVA